MDGDTTRTAQEVRVSEILWLYEYLTLIMETFTTSSSETNTKNNAQSNICYVWKQ